jgi:hypothetical protein
VLYVHNGVLFGHKESNYVVCRYISRTGDHHAK